jgi:L-2,4-diaminobutyrate decarboxylase
MEAAVTIRYRELLEEIRQAFPQPISDRFHDSYFVFTILRALDRVDGKKSEIPLLGELQEPRFAPALAARLRQEPMALEQVIPELVEHLDGMFIWGHPRSQINVTSPPSIASIIGALLPTIYNPNLVSVETSCNLAMAEVRAASMTAALIGYDPEQSGGLFTFGGTGTDLYGLKIGLEKALPGTMEQGLSGERAVILTSDQAHYCRLSIAGWLGLGERNAIALPTTADNAMELGALEQELRDLLEEGVRVAGIVATMGTTDAFGLDDLAGIVAIRDQLVDELRLDYRPHVHADAVIGWAWSVFNDYDIEANPLGFRARTIRALAAAVRRIKHLSLADSVGIDFHKTGFAPYVSSLFLAKDRHDLALISRSRDKMPYLFQSGTYHPGEMTLETSRAATGPMSALANLLLLGKDGLRALLGHLVEMAEVLCEELEARSSTTVLNVQNVGTVTLFRAYPDEVDTFTIKQTELDDPAAGELVRAHNELNRRIFRITHEEALAGKGVIIGLTECYRHSASGEPINALKSYIMSPFTDEANVRMVVDRVLAARRRVLAEMS